MRYFRPLFHMHSQTKSAETDWLSLAIYYGLYSMHNYSTNSFDMHLFVHTHFIECFFYNIADIFPTYSHFGILFALNYLFALILSVVKVTLQVKWCNKMVISIVLDLRNADQVDKLLTNMSVYFSHRLKKICYHHIYSKQKIWSRHAFHHWQRNQW